ncbi:MAG TPA: FtsW/RodA/SpoVE family cell cycle protein [Ktedonobacteraceae bacterium]|jgi:cell division protein FtsW (lipid II flippase)|nr:FtsW/RodA/SpoVE family cell cycle protein [Ktedonobacteraceae bacterium]
MARQMAAREIGRRHYRWRELWLLIVPFLILLLEMFQLPLAQYYKSSISTSTQRIPFSTSILPTVHDLIPILGLIAAVVVVHIALTIFFPKADQVIFPVVALLSGLGVLFALRNGPDLTRGPDPNLGIKQLAWVLIGLVVFLVTLFGLRSMDWLRRYKYTWAVLGLVLVGVTLAHALRTNLNSPTHDQLNFGSTISIQPSEFLKILIVVFFAAYLSENRDVIAEGSIHFGPISLPPMRQLGPLLLMLGISLLLFLGIRELGLALLIYGIFLAMLYLGSGKLSYVLGGLAVFFLLGFIGYALLGYIRQRFAAVGLDMVNWQNWNDATRNFVQNAGLQVAQGLVAISSGGILGAGFGLGHASALVPVAESDMIVSVIAEELGLTGMFALIAFYLFLIYRGYRIAIEAREPFYQLLAGGLTSIFGIQILVICGGNLKLFPLTGLPLPFLSYGGSSIIANFIIIGILLRISHNTAMEREGLA